MIIIFLVSRNPGPKCTLLSSEPMEKGSVRSVATGDFTALANLDGYMMFLQTNTSIFKYFPLDAQYIEVSEETDETGYSHKVLFIDSPCASLKLAVKPEGSISVCDGQLMMKPLPEIDSRLTQCQLPNRMLSFNNGLHYACNHEITHSCDNTIDDWLVKVKIYRLEFEIDGDPKIIKKFEFSKPADTC